jgi:hypothetical protein
LSFYLRYRLLGRIAEVPTVTNRFHTLEGLFSHLLPVLILAAILIFVYWKKGLQNWFSNKKEFLLFIFIGLSASLPLMLTMVQKDFYFSHSIPYFGLAFAILLAPGLSVLIDKIDVAKSGFKLFRWVSMSLLVFAFALSIYNIGGQSRDKEMLLDIYKLGKVIPNNSIIDIENSMIEEWGPRFYLVRYYNISSSPGTNNHDYLLIQRGGDTTGTFRYQKMQVETLKYDLYKKKAAEPTKP